MEATTDRALDCDECDCSLCGVTCGDSKSEGSVASLASLRLRSTGIMRRPLPSLASPDAVVVEAAVAVEGEAEVGADEVRLWASSPWPPS